LLGGSDSPERSQLDVRHCYVHTVLTRRRLARKSNRDGNE
jgi:hypothetical protein